jgi:hypothetical protein
MGDEGALDGAGAAPSTIDSGQHAPFEGRRADVSLPARALSDDGFPARYEGPRAGEDEGARVMSTVSLPVRSYRVYPPPGQDYDDRRYGHVSDVVELTTANTALIAIDLWNLGADGPPLVPDLGKYWEYNYLGGHGVAKRAGQIVVQRIAPVLRAARAAGVAVIHSEPEVIAARYPEARRPERPSTGRKPEDPGWPPAEFRSQLAREHHSRTFGEGHEAAWRRIRQALDVAACVRPEPSDYIVTQSE